MIELGGLIEYTAPELEQMAHEYLRKRPDVQFKIPINVEALLMYCGRVGDIDTVGGLAKLARTEAVIVRHVNQKDLKVFIDEDVVNFGPKATYYAAVAEELAHIVLHGAVFIQVNSILDFIELMRSPQWHQIEHDAKTFSAAIRMPFKNLILAAEKTYPEIVSEHGFGDIATIQKLLRNALAEKFVVPSEDMQRRLLQWPCRIYERTATSAQCMLSTLATADELPRIVERKRQRRMFELPGQD